MNFANIPSTCLQPIRCDFGAVGAYLAQTAGGEVATWAKQFEEQRSKAYKTENKRRARNVESSRRYRKRKRELFQDMEKINQQLQKSIDQAEKRLGQLNHAFHLFIQHAEHCDKCCNVKISFV